MPLTNLQDKLNHIVDLDILPEHPTIVDAGACRGRFIEKMREFRPNAFFIAIEPCRTNVDYLKSRYGHDPNITLWEGALVAAPQPDNAIEFCEFHGLEEWGNVTNLNTDTRHGKLQRLERYMVPAIPVISFMETVPHIDYLKMDIEGVEFNIIYQLHKQDSLNYITQLSMETHHANQVPQIIAWLEDAGFQTTMGKGELYAVQRFGQEARSNESR
jgi:FkbM family methyltransferase